MSVENPATSGSALTRAREGVAGLAEAEEHRRADVRAGGIHVDKELARATSETHAPLTLKPPVIHEDR